MKRSAATCSAVASTNASGSHSSHFNRRRPRLPDPLTMAAPCLPVPAGMIMPQPFRHPPTAMDTRRSEQLAALGADKDSELFFICRSGGRSLMAARAIAAQGFAHCHNVADGIEGPLDQHRRRGTVAGWKAVGLPWLQG